MQRAMKDGDVAGLDAVGSSDSLAAADEHPFHPAMIRSNLSKYHSLSH
jgi:hypothetical protein